MTKESKMTRVVLSGQRLVIVMEKQQEWKDKGYDKLSKPRAINMFLDELITLREENKELKKKLERYEKFLG